MTQERTVQDIVAASTKVAMTAEQIGYFGGLAFVLDLLYAYQEVAEPERDLLTYLTAQIELEVCRLNRIKPGVLSQLKGIKADVLT